MTKTYENQELWSKAQQATPEIKARLAELRHNAENSELSYREIAELQSLVDYIPLGDILLLEWADVPETEEATA